MLLSRKEHMEIIKNGKAYEVKESSAKWIVKATSGIMNVSYEVSKTDCETFDDLKRYIEETDILNWK